MGMTGLAAMAAAVAGAPQWMPRGLSSNCARCSTVAASKRGNQASGTAMRLPSSRWTHMLSSSKRTALAEVVMPSPFDQLSVGLRHLHQLAQRAGVKPVAGADPNLWIRVTAPVFATARVKPAFLIKWVESTRWTIPSTFPMSSG